MATKPSANEFDAIVIGSGMGGMTTATALSRLEHKVLLLEQAQVIGGLTHTFTREGFNWDVGLHYCGIFGPVCGPDPGLAQWWNHRVSLNRYRL
ncbi:MAG: NAD(P)-binding protein [Gammaproteobacteria bacterium]|nr:NAD(P)-binding protein [Gammaproteobacteria bacterium]